MHFGEAIRREVAGAFNSLLADPGGWRLGILGLSFKEISGDAATKLEDPFSTEEVFATLSDLNGDKTLRLDDFSIAFFQFSWDFVKEEIMGLFKEFYEHITSLSEA